MESKLINAFVMCFNKSPKEIVEYLDKQGIEITWDWEEQLEAIKKHCFTVAKVSSADILELIKSMVDKAVAEGKTFRDFKRELYAELVQAGYAQREDGSAWRLDNIYRTNLQSAYMAGRYYKMMDVKENFPYWEFVPIQDNRTTDGCSNLNGVILPADDSFWKTNYPPRHYRCFPKGTKIATVNGWIPIEKISIGDYVLGGSGNNRLVSSTHSNIYNGKLIRIITEEGTSVSTTPNHRILTLRGWIRAENLNTSDVLVNINNLPAFDNIISDIYNPDTVRANFRMSVPIESPNSLWRNALNRKAKLWNENINPKRVNVKIMDRFKSRLAKMLKNKTLALCWNSVVVWMFCIVSFILRNVRLSNFLPYLRTLTCVTATSHLIGILSNGFRNRLVLASHWCCTIFLHFFNYMTQCFGGYSSSLVIVNPLGFDCLAAVPYFNSEMLKEPFERVSCSTPPIRKDSVGKFLFNVKSDEGFTGGAPLDGFNSLDSFIANAFVHNKLTYIDKIEYTNIQNNIDIYNLEVENDESYVTEIAIVHNCRSRVRASSADQLESRGVEVSDPDKYKDVRPAKGFETNPGDWKPDLSKYSTNVKKTLSSIMGAYK